MQNTKFKIEYKVMGLQGVIKEGVMIVKNCDSSMHAQVKLEKYLQNKVPGFRSLHVVKCEPYNDIMDNLFKLFT